MKQGTVKCYIKYSFQWGLMGFLLYVILATMKHCDLYVYLGLVSSEEFMPFLLWLSIVLFLRRLAIWTCQFVKHPKILKGCTIMLLLLISAIYLLYALLFSFDNKYFNFHSDDRKHHIVIEEKSFLLSGCGHIYEMIVPVIMKYVETYETDDSYRPFSNDHYSIEWHENSFILSYDFGAGSQAGDNGYITIEIPYIKKNKKE